MRIINWIKKNIFRMDVDEIPVIVLPTSYNVHSNSISTPEWAMNDAKEQALQEINKNEKLRMKIEKNKHKAVYVKFGQVMMVGVHIDVKHPFYFSDGKLYSMYYDNKEMIRDIKISDLLK